MPYYQAPRSDEKRLAFLRKTLDADLYDRRRGQPYLHPDLRDQVAGLRPAFERALKTLGARKAGRSQQIQERNEALDELVTHLRDFWEVLKRRVARQRQPTSLLEIYGLPDDGLVPKPTTYEEWLNAAAQVVQGDADATAVGYAPMVNPSAEAVRARLDEVYRRAAKVATAERNHELAQEHVVELRAEADEVIQDVMETLRFRLRKLDFDEQRQIMRRYGANFRYRKDERPLYEPASDVDEEGA